MRKPEDESRYPASPNDETTGAAWPRAEHRIQVPFPAGGEADRCGRMSEVDLLLALWETGDLIDAILKLESDAETAHALMEACRELIGIEDELIGRGFSYETFTS